MKFKTTLILALLSTFSYADRLGSLRSNADVLLTTQTVSGIATSSSNTWTAAQTFNSTMSVNTSGAALQSLKITNSGIAGTEIGVNGTANGVGTGFRFGLYGWGSGSSDPNSNYGLYVASGPSHLADVTNSLLATDSGGNIVGTTVANLSNTSVPLALNNPNFAGPFATGLSFGFNGTPSGYLVQNNASILCSDLSTVCMASPFTFGPSGAALTNNFGIDTNGKLSVGSYAGSKSTATIYGNMLIGADYPTITNAPRNGLRVEGATMFDSSATFSSNVGVSGSLTVAGSNVCRADGTNCPASSGSSAQLASQLLDMQVTRTSASILTICATCSATVPVNTGIAGTIYTFNSSATITLGAVTGTVRIYITDGSDGGTVGTIQVRYTGSSGVTCNTGCVVQNSQSSFPTSGGIIPLAQWTATSSGVWDATDSTGVGLRPFLSGTGNFVAGAGMVFTAPRTFSVDPTQVLMIGTTDYGTYGSSGTITFTASLKNMGAVTLTSSATINGPTSPTDGQKFVFRITQDATGSRTVTWATGAGNFSFSTDIPSLTMSTAASAVDYVGAIYSSAKNRWHIVSKSFGS